MGNKMSDDVHSLITKYVNESLESKAKMCSRLFTLFTETTGHRPEDLCLVEEQIRKGTEFKTIYYFDWKSRHHTAQAQ